MAFGHNFEAGHMSFIEIFDHVGTAKQRGRDSDRLKPHVGTHFNQFCFEGLILEEYCAASQARGVKLDRPIKIRMDHSKQAWIKDPDGNVIELMAFTPKSLQF